MNYRSILKNTTVYTLLGFLPTSVNFFMVPLLTSYLTKADYGLISISLIFQGLISIFLNFGFDAAFARFYFSYYKKRRLLHYFYSTTLLAVFLFSGLCFSLFFLFGDHFFELMLKNKEFRFSNYGLLSFLLSCSTILFTIIQTYYRNEENIRAYAFLSVCSVLLNVVFVIYFVVYSGQGAYGNIMGRMMALTVLVLVYLLYYFLKNRPVFRWKYFKKMFGYGLPFVPYMLILAVNGNIDQWLIERYFDLNELGSYNFAFQFSSLISVFIYAIFNAISPGIYRLMAEKQHDARQVAAYYRMFVALVLVAIVFELAFMAPLIKLIIINQSYHTAIPILGILIMSWLPHIYYMLYVVPIMFHGKTRFLPFIMLVSFSSGLIFNLIFIPYLGVLAIGLSTIVIKTVNFLLTYQIAQRQKLVDPGHYRLRKVNILSAILLVSGLLTALSGYFFNSLLIYLNFIPLLLVIAYISVFLVDDIRKIRQLLKF